MISQLNACASVVIAVLCVWVLLSDRVRTGSMEIVSIGLIFMGTVIKTLNIFRQMVWQHCMDSIFTIILHYLTDCIHKTSSLNVAM